MGSYHLIITDLFSVINVFICIQNYVYIYIYSCIKSIFCTPSIQFSHSVVSNSLWPHRLQHARLPCPSPSSRACSNFVHWCHPTISSSVIPFSSSLQSFPASGSFPSGGQSIGASASASVLRKNIQDWFPLGVYTLILCIPQHFAYNVIY